MSQLEKYRLISFETQDVTKIVRIKVPQGAVLLKIRTLPDGVYAYYSISELQGLPDMEEKFQILTGKVQKIPNNSTFIDIVDVVGQTPEKEQVIITFPIFKINS